MTDHSDLIAKLQDRAASYRLGGPSSEHTALLLDQAAIALSSQSLSLSEAREEIERLKKLSDRYGVALMMIRAGCSDPARFAGNILDDRQPVNVELDEEDFDENHR